MVVMPRYMVRLVRHFPALATSHNTIAKDVYGFVPGFTAPSEALKVVRRWFLDEDWENNSDHVRATVAAISEVTHRPFLYKNPYFSSCLERILTVFPCARLIHLKRDVRFTAQSILLARDFLSVENWRWWGLDLPDQDAVATKPLSYQAVWQTHMTNRFLSESAAAAGIDQATIRYEAFCRDPMSIVSDIRTRFDLESRNSSLQRLPRSFPVSAKVRVDAKTWKSIESACDDLNVPMEDRNWPCR
jgi:hypothetical protein